MQYRLLNKPKSIKIIAKSSSKNIFRWIFTYLYFAFDNVFFKIKKRGKNKKNVKKRLLHLCLKPRSSGKNPDVVTAVSSSIDAISLPVTCYNVDSDAPPGPAAAAITAACCRPQISQPHGNIA